MTGADDGISRTDAGTNYVVSVNVDLIVAASIAFDELNMKIAKQAILALAAMVVAGTTHDSNRWLIRTDNLIRLAQVPRRNVLVIVHMAA